MGKSPVPDDAWAAAEAAYPDGGTAASIAVLRALGHEVSRNTVVSHMSNRGISLGPELTGQWTEDEDNILRDWAGRLSVPAMAARFLPRKTADAIRSRAQRLGITVAMTNRRQGGRTEPMLYIPPFEPHVEVRVVFIGDTQIPEIDWEAHKAVRSFLKFYLGNFRGPKYLVNVGDFLNATPLGRFPFDPETPGMDEEIAITKRVFGDYAREAGPGTEHVVIEGNHEYRASKLLQRDPHLKGMIAPWWQLLEFDSIFGQGKWHWVPYMQGYVDFCDALLVHHGYRVSGHSAYAAKAHVENTGRSILTGHVHRLGVHYKTYYDRQVVGIENGCLCVPQHYAVGTSNQQLGFTYGRFFGQRFEFSQVPIIDGRGFAEGRWFPAQETQRLQSNEPSPG